MFRCTEPRLIIFDSTLLVFPVDKLTETKHLLNGGKNIEPSSLPFAARVVSKRAQKSPFEQGFAAIKYFEIKCSQEGNRRVVDVVVPLAAGLVCCHRCTGPGHRHCCANDRCPDATVCAAQADRRNPVSCAPTFRASPVSAAHHSAMAIPTRSMKAANTRLSARPLIACARRAPSGAVRIEAAATPIAAGR